MWEPGNHTPNLQWDHYRICGVALPYTQMEDGLELTSLARSCRQSYRTSEISSKFRLMIPSTFSSF